MGLNIVCTSKPCDGLFFYSYEYCTQLNELGIDSNVVVITRGDFQPQDYIDSINEKYVHCKNLYFNDYIPDPDDVTLIMGRSMITIPYTDIHTYSEEQVYTLHEVFSRKLISVYSENHRDQYQPALEYFGTEETYDLCDHEVYPNGVGDQFEKIINFSIYKDPVLDIKYDHLFLGTNREYYETVDILYPLYNNSCIITYDEDFVNPKNTNIFAPVKNLLGIFDTYVYTKEAFDPAPRLIQECFYYGKNIIYQRDKSIVDGGSVYYKRGLIDININPIIQAFNSIK